MVTSCNAYKAATSQKRAYAYVYAVRLHYVKGTTPNDNLMGDKFSVSKHNAHPVVLLVFFCCRIAEPASESCRVGQDHQHPNMHILYILKSHCPGWLKCWKPPRCSYMVAYVNWKLG